MKKIWIILLSVVLLAGLIAAGIGIRSYYLFLKQPLAPLTRAIPENTVVFIRSGSVTGFIEKTRSSGLIDILENNETTKGFHTLSSWFDSVSHLDDYLRKLLDENEFLISFSPDSLGRPSFLFVIKTGKIRVATLNYHLRNTLKKSGHTITSARHQPAGLYHIQGASEESWYYFYRGLFVLSTDRSLLEQSLEAINDESRQTGDAALVKLSATAGKRVDGVLFFRNRLLYSQLTGLGDSPLLTANSPFDGWSALDISLRKEKIQLSGFTWNGKETSFLSGQTPVSQVDLSYIPLSAAFGFTLLLSDPVAYVNQFTPCDTLHVTGFDTINSIPVKEVFRMREHLWSWAGPGISYVARAPYLQNNKKTAMLLISSKCRDSAEMALRPFLQATGGKAEKLMASGLPAKLWGPWFDLQDPLYCYIGQNVVAFSHSCNFLSSYASEQEAGTGGMNHASFNGLQNDLIDKSNLIFYLKPDQLVKMLTDQGKKGKQSTAAMWTSYFSGFDQLIMNFNAGSPMLYAQGSLHFKDELTRTRHIAYIAPPEKAGSGPEEPEKTKSRIQEQAKMPAVAKKPGKTADFVSVPVVIAGEKPGERLIAMFTAKNTLEVYDYEGGYRWSFQCRGNVTGDIYEADYRKNGQRHYLVFTKEYLHILDRNGKEIKGSPVALPEKAIGSAALFDYDRKRDYRVIYEGHDNLIHNITLRGEPLPDWQKPRIGNLAGKTEFFRTGGRDYLIFGTGEGRLLITDRRGRERISVPANFRKSRGAELFENKTNSKGLFLTASDDGRLAYITEDGIISYSSFGDFGKHPWFLYADFDGDGSHDFIFAGNDQISVFSRMKGTIASKSIKGSRFSKPFLYISLSGERWLAIRDEKSDRVVVMRSRGSAQELNNLTSETDPVIFNPGGRRKEVLVTTRKGKLILTPIQ